jgi:hypothetical protein
LFRELARRGRSTGTQMIDSSGGEAGFRTAKNGLVFFASSALALGRQQCRNLVRLPARWSTNNAANSSIVAALGGAKGRRITALLPTHLWRID